MNDTPATADDPELAEAVALQARGAFAEAAEVWSRAAARRLTLSVAFNLGLCLKQAGRLETAERWLGLAREHRPQNLEVRRLMGALYAEMGRTAEAEAEYRAALAIDPDSKAAQLALGSLLLSVGRYREGWSLTEARLALRPDAAPPITLSFPEWRGEPLAGRSILMWFEQGLGDQIQFVRFAGALKAAGAAHVAISCRPALAALFVGVPGVDEVIPVGADERIAVRRYDLWTRFLTVPGRLGTTLETLPPTPYVFAPPGRRDQWSGWSGVGFAWRASPTGFNARNKTIPDPLAARLIGLGARSLHPEDTGARDFADTAAIIDQLDLVISIDTSVAHLAGAMGRPCWTLIPRLHADWRWLRDRTDTPWYPTMRLFRQQTPHDWSETIEAVADALVARRGAG